MEEVTVNNKVQFLQALSRYDDYLICSHTNPDADSIGSMLAMYCYLEELGKNVTMVVPDPIPDWPLPNIDKMRALSDQEHDNIIILDCEPKRTGSLLPLIEKAQITFNVDHHKGNHGTCTYNLIDTEQAATCMILYQLFKTVNFDMDYDLAQPLYAGIVGDTGGFRHANTTTEVFKAAADLTAHGAVPHLTAEAIFATKPLEWIRFLGDALTKIETKYENRLVWLVLSDQDFQKHGIDPSQCDQFIDYIRMTAGSEISILFREIAPDVIRIGFRSRGINIHQLALRFGGGGHLLAAGAQVNNRLADTVEQVVAAASKLLEGDRP